MTGPWGVLGLALVLGFLLVLLGRFTEHTALALVALVLVGMVVPALGWGIGAVIVFKVLLSNPQVFSGSLVDAFHKLQKGFQG